MKHPCNWLLFMALLVITPTTDAASSLEQRLGMVAKLLDESSGARQVRASGEPEALRQMQEAQALYERARAAAESGSGEEAARLLTEASKQMFLAIRSSHSTVNETKGRRDLLTRQRSVDALMIALQRIGSGIGGGGDVDATRQVVNGNRVREDALAEEGNLDQAMVLAQQSYELLRSLLEEARTGATLVDSLSFESPDDELAYEIDRNETHQMLVRMLVEQKKPAASTRKMIDGYVAKAMNLRGDSDAHMEAGRIAQAIESLDASTKELIRAIRLSGVYIPG